MGAMREYNEQGVWLLVPWDEGDASVLFHRVKKQLVAQRLIAEEAAHKYGLALFWMPEEGSKKSPEFALLDINLSSEDFFLSYVSFTLAVIELPSTLATTLPKKVAATKVPPSKNDQTQEEYELPQEYTEAKAEIKQAEVALRELFQHGYIPPVKGTRKRGKERLSDYQKCIQLYVRAVLIELANQRNLLRCEAQVEKSKTRMRETADIDFGILDDDISAEELPKYQCPFALAGWELPNENADTEATKVRPIRFKEACQHFQVVLNRALKINGVSQENMWTIRRGFRLTHMKKNSEERTCEFTDIGDDEDVLSYCFQVFDDGKTLALPADPQYQYTLALKIFKKWFRASTCTVQRLFMEAIKYSCVAIDALCNCKQIKVHFATNQSYRKLFPLVHKKENTDLANVTKPPEETEKKGEVEADDDTDKVEADDDTDKVEADDDTDKVEEDEGGNGNEEDEGGNGKENEIVQRMEEGEGTQETVQDENEENMPTKEEEAAQVAAAKRKRRMEKVQNDLGYGNIIGGPRTGKRKTVERLRNNLVNQK